ncbi:MAG: hypothetical protein AVDCRST_MAG33-2331, partial [uncultured Thermomicrobiales bacterium]
DDRPGEAGDRPTAQCCPPGLVRTRWSSNDSGHGWPAILPASRRWPL